MKITPRHTYFKHFKYSFIICLTIFSCRQIDIQRAGLLSDNTLERIKSNTLSTASSPSSSPNPDRIILSSVPKKIPDVTNEFILLTSLKHFKQVIDLIDFYNGKIIFADQKTGYIHLKATNNLAISLYNSKLLIALEINKPLSVKTTSDQPETTGFNNSHLTVDFNKHSPSIFMRTNELVEEFDQNFNEPLNGSSTTIAIVDTGLDISRTDVFQDRIIGLRSIRQSDRAILKEAKEEIIDGEDYLTATIGQKKITIKKTHKLIKSRTYYLGYFSERQFSSQYKGFDNYDFNQDGKADAVFPVIAFKNDEGRFETYINVNDKGIYPEKGDYSIEDENKLLDFNWVAQNIKDRYINNPRNPIKSYYRFTTRLDILDKRSTLQSSSQTKLLSDRNKGTVTIAITMEPGIELSLYGNDLKHFDKDPNDGAKLYQIGLVGFDLEGHGTYCAGTAAGNFQSAIKDNYTASQAKLVGLSLIGPNAPTNGNYLDTLSKMIDNFNINVINISFGENQEINDTKSVTAMTLERLIRSTHVAIVKAAGNNGPGINTHGIVTTPSVISVASYYLAYQTHHFHLIPRSGILKYYVSNSSSRGPMIDGVLKPDIGAPGWSLSAVPLATPFSSTNNSLNFYRHSTGTSNATSNTTAAISLLYDALNKSNMANIAPSSNHVNPIPISHLHKALKNSALPYSPYTTYECKTDQHSSPCIYQPTSHRFNWIDGGAGRIDALNVWAILQQIITETSIRFNASMTSKLNNYHRKAHGFISYDSFYSSFRVDLEVDDYPSQKDGDSPTNDHELLLKIDEKNDWLSFSSLSALKKKQFSISSDNKTAIYLYIDRYKLIENGQIKPGIHQTVIKGYKDRLSQYFDLVFPVIIVGASTRFDSTIDNNQYATKGFIPAGLKRSYFLPIKDHQSSVLLNLQVTHSEPGSINLDIFHNGIKLPLNNFKLSSVNPTSNPSSQSNHVNTHETQSLRYLLKELDPGLYEIALQSSSKARTSFQELDGSFYQITASQFSLKCEKATKNNTSTSTQVLLKNVRNQGSLITIDSANISISGFKEKHRIAVSNQKEKLISIDISPEIDHVQILTNYFGVYADTDVDIYLYRDHVDSGRSATNGFEESISLNVEPGRYSLKLVGYYIPDPSGTIELTIIQKLKTPHILSTRLNSSRYGKTVAKGFIWEPNKMIPRLYANIPIKNIKALSLNKASSPILTVDITASYGHRGEKVNVLHVDIE